MSRETSVSVVIPTHNAATTLGRQLRALAAQRDAPPFEVIVSLNRCEDHSEAVAKGFGDRLDLRAVRADERAGTAFARNAGVRASHAAVVLHADADDEVLPGWVAAMTHALWSADLVGGLLRPPDDAHVAWHVDLRLHQIDELPVSRGVRYAVGCSMGYHRAVFETIGGFDERIVGGSEDIAFALAAQRAGFRLTAASGAATTYVPRYERSAALRQRYNYGKSEAWLRTLYSPEQLRSPIRELAAGSAHATRLFASGTTRDQTRRRSRIVSAAYAWGRVAGGAEVVRAGAWPSRSERKRPPPEGAPIPGAVQRTLDPELPVVGGRLVDHPNGQVPAATAHLTIELLATLCSPTDDVIITFGASELALAAMSLATHGTTTIVASDRLTRCCLHRTLSRCSRGRSSRGLPSASWAVIDAAELEQRSPHPGPVVVLSQEWYPRPPVVGAEDIRIELGGRTPATQSEIGSIRLTNARSGWSASMSLTPRAERSLSSLRAADFEVG